MPFFHQLKYFQVFGCQCFILNNGKDYLEKFDAKSDEGIFLGYSTSSKAYRVFNKWTLVVEESVHVVFEESTNKSSRKEDTSDECAGADKFQKLTLDDQAQPNEENQDKDEKEDDTPS